ncbi:hypothetical protein FD754_021984, partial [Muntiacus muntjak]
EYRIKPVEEVKYMKNGAEEEQKIAARNQENLEVKGTTEDEMVGWHHRLNGHGYITLITSMLGDA